jgi:hypothetical protein
VSALTWVRTARGARRVLVGSVVAVLATTSMPAAVHAAPSARDTSTRPMARDITAKVASWDVAAARLGTAGSLWEPARTAGLPLAGRISVIADNLEFQAGSPIAGDTFAGARYVGRKASLSVSEKWADTGWAAEPAFSTSMAKVATVAVPLGLPGTRIRVMAQVYANCFPQPADRDPRPVPTRFRCTRADVLRTGGVLTMTATPPSQMTAPGTTSIVLASRGLTFTQLVSVAASLQQVAGAAAEGAGSAQMRAMCRQMVQGRMTVEQASGFADSNGYSVRVGSIDGQPQPVTADYRPDRFTVAVTGGVVVSCTYG